MQNKMNDSIEKQLSTLGHFLGNKVCQTLGPNWTHRFNVDDEGSITMSILVDVKHLEDDLGISIVELSSIAKRLESEIKSQGLGCGDSYITHDGKDFAIENLIFGGLEIILENGGAGWTLSRS